jgi:hypothetical protein
MRSPLFNSANSTINETDHPTLFVGAREDVGALGIAPAGGGARKAADARVKDETSAKHVPAADRPNPANTGRPVARCGHYEADIRTRIADCSITDAPPPLSCETEDRMHCWS